MNRISRAIDGIIATVAPQFAMKRAGARHKMQILNSGYGNYGANVTKKSLLGWNYAGGSWREDINENLPTLRQRSRDIYMGVPIGSKYYADKCCGAGLMPKPTIDADVLKISPEKAKELERKISKEWELWAESADCDMARRDNF